MWLPYLHSTPDKDVKVLRVLRRSANQMARDEWAWSGHCDMIGH